MNATVLCHAVPPRAMTEVGLYSLEAVVELPGQGDRDESETAKECQDKGEGEVVDPIFDPIEEEADEDGRQRVRFEVVVPVPHPSRDLRVVGARWGLHIVHERQIHGRQVAGKENVVQGVSLVYFAVVTGCRLKLVQKFERVRDSERRAGSMGGSGGQDGLALDGQTHQGQSRPTNQEVINRLYAKLGAGTGLLAVIAVTSHFGQQRNTGIISPLVSVLLLCLNECSAVNRREQSTTAASFDDELVRLGPRSFSCSCDVHTA